MGVDREPGSPSPVLESAVRAGRGMTHKRAGTAPDGPRIAQNELGAPVPARRPAGGPRCVSCGRGPVRPGDRCGWCGKRATRERFEAGEGE